MTERWRSVALLVLTAPLMAAMGCHRSATRGTDLPPPKNRIRSGHAPTPFTAAQIRTGCPDGHFRRYRIEVPGKPGFVRILRFEGGTKLSTLFVSQQLDAAGKPFGEQRRVRALWKALQVHASFPEDTTTITSVTHTTPAGTFPGWLYEVRTRSGGQAHVKRFWFAKSLPGPPVQFDHLINGKRVFRMLLVKTGATRPPKVPGTER